MSVISHNTSSHQSNSTKRYSNSVSTQSSLPVAGVRTGQDQQSKDYTALYSNAGAPRVYLQDVDTFMPKRNLLTSAIPGYGGYIPGFRSETNYAQTYSKTKDTAVRLCSERKKGNLTYDPFRAGPNTQSDVPALFNNLTSAISGYAGYIPQKSVVNTYGRNFRRENAVARHIIENGSQKLPQDGTGLSLTHNRGPFYESSTDKPRKRGSTPPPITGVPGYTGYFPKYMEEQRWIAKNFLEKHRGVDHQQLKATIGVRRD